MRQSRGVTGTLTRTNHDHDMHCSSRTHRPPSASQYLLYSRTPSSSPPPPPPCSLCPYLPLHSSPSYHGFRLPRVCVEEHRAVGSARMLDDGSAHRPVAEQPFRSRLERQRRDHRRGAHEPSRTRDHQREGEPRLLLAQRTAYLQFSHRQLLISFGFSYCRLWLFGWCDRASRARTAVLSSLLLWWTG